MAEAMSTQIPACCSSHMPQHYWGQTQPIQSTSDKQLNEGEVLAKDIQRDRNLDISQWNTNFGPQSGVCFFTFFLFKALNIISTIDSCL